MSSNGAYSRYTAASNSNPYGQSYSGGGASYGGGGAGYGGSAPAPGYGGASSYSSSPTYGGGMDNSYGQVCCIAKTKAKLCGVEISIDS